MSELSGVCRCNQPKKQQKRRTLLQTSIVPSVAGWFANKCSDTPRLVKVLCVIAMVMGLTACSPALDWRTLDIAEAAIAITLPCKPDRATRTVTLAGSDVALSMVGCEADGATFAVSHVALADPAKVATTLQHWQAAVLQGLQGVSTGQPQASQDTVSKPWAPRGSSPLPGGVHLVAEGTSPNGQSMHMQAVWFARVVGAQVLVYHAVYLSPQTKPDVADAFFGGIFFQ